MDSEAIDHKSLIQQQEKEIQELRQNLEIELMLDKIRTASLSMEKSNEFNDIALQIFSQLSKFGLKVLGTGFNIVQEDETTHKKYLAFSDPVTGAYSLKENSDISLDRTQVLVEAIKKFKQGESFHTSKLEGPHLEEWIDHVEEDIDKDRANTLKKAGYKCIYVNMAVFSGLSNLTVTSTEPLTAKQEYLFVKLAKAFGLPYRRFLDLQKAEKQAREAQIEAALERVRARSMAMHKSEQVGEVVRELFTQMQPFGLAQWGFAIRIALEDGTGFSNWVYTPGQQTVRQDFIIPSSGHWVLDQTWQVYKDQIQFESITVEGDEKAKVDAIVFAKNEIERIPLQIQKSVTDARFVRYSCSAMKYGMLVAIDHSKGSGDEDFSILSRFAKVFEQTYTRFLDLQKAEAQTKEAQIEAALERVRASTMAMHHSEGLVDVVSVTYEQLIGLGSPIDMCVIILKKPETEDLYMWIASPEQTYRQELHVPYFDHPLFEQLRDGFSSDAKYFPVDIDATESRSWYQHVFQHTIVGEVVNNERRKRLVSVRGQTGFCTNLKHHGLMILSFAGYHYTEEEIGTVLRVSNVFEQAYIRFLDLQKAEKQAKEAQIEAALERVRSRTMAMHSSVELREVVNEFFNQMDPFNLAEWGFQIRIAKEDKTGFYAWLSTPSQRILPKQYDIPNLNHWTLKKYWDIFEKQVPYDSIEVQDEDKRSMDLLLFKESELIDLPDTVKENILTERYVLFSVASMKYGLLEAIDTKPKGDEEIEILKRFAKVFEQTYTRFLDLQKAEKRVREAQVEAALERVRAHTMAMQTSHDIGISVTSLFESLVELGISETVRCGIGILNHSNTNMDLWTASSTKDSKVILNTGQIDMSEHPLLRGVYNCWKAQDPHFSYLLSEEDLVHYHQVINNSANYPTKIDVNNLPKEISHNSFFFEHGALYAFSDTPLPNDVMQILERLSIVFEHTYTRFLDLQNAELREKEAIKQACLDRIRAETASMRTASDLDQITPLIWRELITLNVPFIRCGVFIMDETEEVIYNYLSTPAGEAIASFKLPYRTPGTISQMLSHWRNEEIFLDYWDKSSMLEFSNVLVENGVFSNPGDYLQTLPTESFYLHFLPFLQGMLYVGNVDRLDADQIDLLQGVSHAFSTAYARFEDFKKLEVAKSQVDQALQNLQEAQQQLIHAEKMASLGELTAGIAHEIQNPLNFVNNFSEIGVELVEEIEEELKENDIQAIEEILPELIQNLQKIHHHGERASGIVRGMLDHSRAHSDEKTLTDINQLCDEYLRLAYHGLRAKDNSFQANFHLEADPDLPKILVVSQDIGRVFLNLINNGFQAIMERSKKEGGAFKPTLMVKTKNLKNAIQIDVMDNGLGIPEEVRDKIFQPFFTTKPTGDGTGLGLSLAYDIVKAHGGNINVESTPATETRFIITLPV